MHGYTTKSPVKKEYSYFPHFYTYSHQHPKPFRKITDSQSSEAQKETLESVNYNDANGQQRVKRKITHQQSYAVPQKPLVQYLMLVPVAPTYTAPQYNRYNYYLKQIYDPNYRGSADNNAVNYIEQQMLDNLKSIILKSQLPPNIEGITFNPLVQSLPHENSFVQYRKPDVIYGSSGYINNIPNMPWNVYQYEGYSPDKETETPSKVNTPMTLYNSLTTITEYDNDEKCKTNINQLSSSRNAKSLLGNVPQQRYIVDIDKSIEVAAFTEETTPSGTVIMLQQQNGRDLKDNEDRGQQTTVSDIDNDLNRSEKKLVKPTKQNVKETDEKGLNPLQLFLQHQQNKNKPTGTSTEETNKDLINENNKKFLSKDNTGSGIFIHRLKVRKGGVAIAGPGGIATAGSGGTAIVGPNGFAYTHPDSLAIAGSGSRVIAVDPKVNLGDIVKGKEDGSRVGKLVAVGPVIYYNKG